MPELASTSSKTKIIIIFPGYFATLIGNWEFLFEGFPLYRGNPSLRNWPKVMYLLCFLKMKKLTGPNHL